jgi:hypothetical protein
MGERSDELGREGEQTGTPFERGQDAAGHNAELMRERLGPGNQQASNLDNVTEVTSTNYIIETPASPAPLGRNDMSGSSDYPATEDVRNQSSEAEPDASTDEIRGDIEDTRARMGSTIDEIQDRLNPQHLMHQAKGAAREATIGRVEEMANNVADSAKQSGSTFMSTLRDNPVPAALAAVGLGWLFISARREAAHRHDQADWYGRNPGRYDARYGDSGGYGRGYNPYAYQPGQDQDQGGQSKMSQMSDSVQNTAGKMGDQIQSTASNVADRAGDMADYAQWQAQRTRGWLERTWDERPLLLTGAVLALGTVVGLAVPETGMEDRLMGDTRDSLVRKAEGVAQNTVQKAQDAATNAADTSANQARQQSNQSSSTSRSGSTSKRSR